MMRKFSSLKIGCFALATALSYPLFAAPPVFEAKIIAQYPSADAYQAIAVDGSHFYAINNTRITKHDKQTGAAKGSWGGVSGVIAGLMHLDSGVVVDGKLYAAHSNYPLWPMKSSIEVWDAEAMEHIDSHDYGVLLGSMTWIDRFDESWWGTFGNYDRVQTGADHPYGGTSNTVIVKLGQDFSVLQQWALPEEILARMTPMSNSGGSWGADGFLYLTGHNYPEIYVMQIPATGSILDWVATVVVPGLDGQGIAWDRTTSARELWAILRNDRQVLKIQMPELPLTAASQVPAQR